MDNSDLLGIYATLLRAGRRLEMVDDPDVEMLLCELDEQRSVVAEHIAWNIAEENFNNVGGDLDILFSHAKDQVREELAGADNIL